ncbi:hypothetical protein GW813_15215, partial [bacterium]|nr:hypothetical protein [bacterium]
PAQSEEVGPSWIATVGEAHPDMTVTGERTKTGTLTTVRLEWSAIEAITGSRPT